ncbi:MAG: hypothetical protein ACM31C_04765 [Acidobacteriota bacterium]
MRRSLLVVVAACGGATTPRGTAVTLRAACGAGEYWNGRTCARTGDAAGKLAEGKQALDKLDVDDAKRALDAAEQAGPLDRAHHIELWEQRGIAAAYVDDEAAATKAFDMLLALDPGHFLSYTLSPKATFVFEKVRTAQRAAPELDVSWQRGGKVGDDVPLGVEVLSDPKQFLRRATLFVRTRGETAWRAADLTLQPHGEERVVLPAIEAHKPVSLELYLKAYDDRGNEVLTWADPVRPREIALRYEPPTPWFKTWWGITAMVAGGVAVASVTAYELTLAPPDKINATVGVK